MTLRKRVYHLLEPSVSGLRIASTIEYFFITLIVCNIAVILLETVPRYDKEYGDVFQYFDVFSVLIFTFEYILRVWTCVEKPQYQNKFSGRFMYSLSGPALIDLLSILPFYLYFFPIDLRVLRIFRLFRLLRLLKIARYLTALSLIFAVIRERREQLMVVLMFIFFLLVITSTIMYYVEGPYQPEKFSSIPATMWWGIATLTTVGYGDMIPMSTGGKILAGLISIIGVGMYALPAGILSAGISDHIRSHKHGGSKHCPHCGKEL